MRSSDATPDWWAKRLGWVRGFARYAQALDPRNQVPPPDLLPRRTSRLTPYLYSDEEVEALMKATRSLRRPIKPSTYATLIGLLATTGLRIGEAISLDQADLDATEGVLLVRQGKFGKSRLLPLHPTVQAALQAYARKRDQIFPHPKSPAFFVSSAGTRLFYSNVHNTFTRLLKRSGVGEGACRHPRIHDLRHTFAFKTLLDWYRQGLDVDAWMPRLSTYLGHVSPASTYWYLTATPELVSLAVQRVERLTEDS